MCVPGVVLPVAGVTSAAVLPTHRRRGVLRSLVRRQFADIAAEGEEPIAALWATEAPIYGRYGYGPATSNAYFRFERGDGMMTPTAPSDPALWLRLADPSEAVPELARVYDTVLQRQPGFFTRCGGWWSRVLHRPQERRAGSSPLRCLLRRRGEPIAPRAPRKLPKAPTALIEAAKSANGTDRRGRWPTTPKDNEARTRPGGHNPLPGPGRAPRGDRRGLWPAALLSIVTGRPRRRDLRV